MHNYPAAILSNHDGDYRAAYEYLAKRYQSLEQQFCAVWGSRFFEVSRFEADSEVCLRQVTRGKHPRLCTIVDYHVTRNLAGEVVKARYVATHEVMGQVVTDYDVIETTVSMGVHTTHCIRCGGPYLMRARTDADDGKAFAERYCPPCAAKLPVLPVITAVEVTHG